jgi:hypothetical protein
MGINNPLEIRLTPSYQRLLDYWNGKSAKPSQAEAQTALDELLENIRLEKNIYHKDVTDAMFRQVRTAGTIPFIPHPVGEPATIPAGGRTTNLSADRTTINAVDYDLGRQRSAYYDRDTASYQYTPGVKTVGNRGRAYRNDGVDIMAVRAGGSGAGTVVEVGDGGIANGYYIFSIEDGEWLQYTVQVAKKGKYKIGFTVSASVDTGRISLSLGSGSDWPVRGLAVPVTGATSNHGGAGVGYNGGTSGSGGATNWQRIEAKDLPLEAGSNILRVHAEKGGWNFASIDISR